MAWPFIALWNHLIRDRRQRNFSNLQQSMSMPAWVPVSDWLHSTLKLNCDLIASHFPSQCQFIYEHQFISVNVDSMIWAINKSRIEHVAWFFKLSMAVFQSQRHLAWPPWDRARGLRKWKGRLWVQAWKFYLKSLTLTVIDIAPWLTSASGQWHSFMLI